MPPEHQRLDQFTEQAEGSSEFHDVGHNRAISARFEVVVVGVAVKRTVQHGVLEAPRTVKNGNEALVRQHQAEVTPLPRNGLVQTDQSSGDAGNGSLASTVCRRNVEVDAARKVEAALDRSRDWSGQFDAHRARSETNLREDQSSLKTDLHKDQS